MTLSQSNKSLRCREITGPTPHSVAVKAKFPSDRPHDHITLERRKQDDLREQMMIFTKQNNMKDVKSQWELITEHKILHNTVQRKVDEQMKEYQMEIEKRRDRLKALLEAEELMYIQEMESKEETTLERQAKMRERARHLRERREKERLALVKEKLDQQFREQCEELRIPKSHKHQLQVCTERMAQLVVKEEQQRQRKEEENLYAELWEKDRLAKMEVEEQKYQKRMQLNKEMVDVLQVQKAATEALKEKEKRLKEEGARLLVEQRKLLKLEDERALREKRQKQTDNRKMLKHSIRLKMKRLGRDQQEELSLDLKILEQMMQDIEDDTAEQRQRKVELQQEQHIYRQYLANQLEEEKRQEQEMDMLIEAELEKSMAKRAEQLRLEKEARNQLMMDVMATRKIQIQEKLERNASEQEDLAENKELLEKAMAEHKQLEAERNARKLRENLQYQQHLQSQLAYQEQMRGMEKEEERQEYEAGIQAENSYREKLQDFLSRPYILQENIHPLRKTRISGPKDWLPQ